MAPLELKTKHEWRAKRAEPSVLRSLFYSALMALVFVELWFLPLGQYLDEQVYGMLSSVSAGGTPPDGIVIVGIDEPTYKTLGLTSKQSVPRRSLAQAVSRIHAAKPRLVVLAYNSAPEAGDGGANKELSQAIERGPTIIAGTSISRRSPEGGLASTDSLDSSVQIETTHEFLNSAHGVIRLTFLFDGRSVRLLSSDDKPNLSAYDRIPLLRPLRTFTEAALADPGPRDLINFYGPAGTIPSVSLSDVLKFSESDLASKLNGRVVLIAPYGRAGEASERAGGWFPVPAGLGQMSAVEIHATIGANIIDGTWIRRLSLFNEVRLIALLVLGLCFLMLRASSKGACFLYLFSVCVWFGASYLAFIEYFFFIPGAGLFAVLGPVIVAVIVFAPTLAAKFSSR